MATIQQNPQPSGRDESLHERQAPEEDVDRLLHEGTIEQSRAEFERLCLEGLDSGEPIAMTPERWDDLRRELHNEASRTS